MTTKSSHSTKHRKEIVIPVSKIQTKKKVLDLNQEIEAAAEQLTEEIEHNPWAIHEIDHTNDSQVKAMTDGRILVKFSKFVQLIATHDFSELVEQYDKEDIIISSDLLVDLAGSPHDDIQESKFSWVFLGVVLGSISVAIIFMLFIK